MPALAPVPAPALVLACTLGTGNGLSEEEKAASHLVTDVSL